MKAQTSARLADVNSSFTRIRESTLIQPLALMFLLCVLPVQQVRTPTGLWDPDIWWHVRVGHWIMKHHAFPHAGIFSQVGEGRSWVAYSWGFEVMAAALQRWLGIKAMPLFVIVFGIIFTLLLFELLRRLGAGFWSAWLLTLAAVWSANLNLVGAARPAEFSMAFFTIELWLVFRACRERNQKYLYLLPGMFFVWANIHIQFLYGLLLPGLLAMVATLDNWAEHRQIAWWPRSTDLEAFRPKFLWVIFIGCLAATLLNPYGLGLYRTIFLYMRSSFAYRVINELQAIDFRDSANYTQLMLMAAAYFVLGRRRTDLFRLLLLVIVSLVAFRALRDAWFVCITAAVIVADLLGETAPAVELSGTLSGPGLLRISAVLSGVLCVVLLSASDAHFNSDNMLKILHRLYPVDAANYIEEHRPPGPLFNTFNWGGFLIAALPDYPVSIDGRNDLYGDDLLRRETETTAGVDWANDPAMKTANLALIPIQSPLSLALEQSSQFELAYSDGVAKVFVRTRR